LKAGGNLHLELSFVIIPPAFSQLTRPDYGLLNEQDAFAKSSIGTGEYLIEGLKELTVTNLGNLTPHALTVWLSYSHPPVLSRIKALNNSE